VRAALDAYLPGDDVRFRSRTELLEAAAVGTVLVVKVRPAEQHLARASTVSRAYQKSHTPPQPPFALGVEAWTTAHRGQRQGVARPRSCSPVSRSLV
jgi:hypothetical protein